MINGKTILAIIPARGGSKGIPHKNIKKLGGKPLIAWTIEEAKKSEYIDRLILSSEDEEIIKIAKEWGCDVPFVRPKELALDGTPGIEPIIHAINNLKEKYDYVVLLQPTSPFRGVEDINNCIEHCETKKSIFCVSVVETDKSPFWMYTLTGCSKLKPLFPEESKCSNRQELPKIYIPNGAIFIASIRHLTKTKSFYTKETVAFIMQATNSIDIDSQSDLEFCEFILSKRTNI
jgi:N-acylneuraminate cytidylyltransferase